MLYFIGRSSESVTHGRVCLELRQKVLGSDHPETIDSLSDLAASLALRGEVEIAEQMQRQAFEASERILGPGHPDTLNCLSSLASALAYQSKFEEAEATLRQSIRLEVNNPLIKFNRWRQHNLAVTLEKQGKYDEAEEWYRCSLEMREKDLGKCNVETIVTLVNYVVLLDELEKWADIRKLSGWFTGEPREAYKMQENDNQELRRELRKLKPYDFDAMGSVSRSGDEGSDDGLDKNSGC